MAYGLIIRNNNDRIVISSDTNGISFVGNATFTNTTKPDGYVSAGVAAIPGSGTPFYIYTISCEYPPMIFMQLTSAYFIVCSINSIGTNLWEIVVGGPIWTSPPILKCFARLSGQGVAGYGLRVRNANGDRTWDSNEKMLIVKRKIDFSAASNISTEDIHQDVSFSGFTAPYVMNTSGVVITGEGYTHGPGALNTITEYIPGYALVGTTLTRTSRAGISFKFLDDTFPTTNNLGQDRLYVIEGSNY